MNNKMFDMVFNLKFQAKTLNRQAAKCEKNEKLEKDKAFKAMKKNNMDGAQIHAANAIRLHNENLQFLRISSQCVAILCACTHFRPGRFSVMTLKCN
jgi:charged multivesicular body protein 1